MRSVVLGVVLLTACSSPEPERAPADPAPTAPAAGPAATPPPPPAPPDASVPDAAPPMPDRFVEFRFESDEPAVLAHRREVDDCLMASRSALPAHGTIGFALGARGFDAMTKTSTAMRKLVACLRSAAEQWQVPKRERPPGFTIAWDKHASDAELRDKVAKEAELAIGQMFAEGDGSSGAIADVLAGGGNDLDKQLAEIDVAHEPGTATRGERGGGAVASGGITGGPSVGDQPAKPTVKGRVSIGTVSSDDDYADRARDVITRRGIGLIKRCYERVLRTDPTAAGTLELRLRISPLGRVTSAKATAFDAAVGSCVEAVARNWRFPAPPADGAEVTARVACKPL